MTMWPVTGCTDAVTKTGAKCKAGTGNACADSTCD
jgi:hypothetical protein